MPQTSISTTLAPPFAGVLGDQSFQKDVLTYFNAEASNYLPFGVVAMQGTGDQDALLVTAGNVAKLLGIVVYSAAYQKNLELATTVDANGKLGILPGVPLGILDAGVVWVQVEEAVTPASAVRIRCTAAGNGQGTFRTSSAGGGLSMNLSSYMRYLDTAGINGFSRVKFNFTMRAGGTAD
jgi:hypothetical protein